ncbi:phospholipase, patatin family protein [Toxoplasma gondii VAND]|uniref:Phospholipase, patatin family protein n=1 Tax=Toxoplasma gondii VAND TaxID=933077 RepID=A0A086Q259_TOXGO|nr:phospholipase, patatin family protein [Toxoplasma gondii VAND]
METTPPCSEMPQEREVVSFLAPRSASSSSSSFSPAPDSLAPASSPQPACAHAAFVTFGENHENYESGDGKPGQAHCRGPAPQDAPARVEAAFFSRARRNSTASEDPRATDKGTERAGERPARRSQSADLLVFPLPLADALHCRSSSSLSGRGTLKARPSKEGLDLSPRVSVVDRMVSKTSHEVLLSLPGYYTLCVANKTDSSWDGLFMGLAQMRVVCEYSLLAPPTSLCSLWNTISPPDARNYPSPLYSSSESCSPSSPCSPSPSSSCSSSAFSLAASSPSRLSSMRSQPPANQDENEPRQEATHAGACSKGAAAPKTDIEVPESVFSSEPDTALSDGGVREDRSSRKDRPTARVNDGGATLRDAPQREPQACGVVRMHSSASASFAQDRKSPFRHFDAIRPGEHRRASRLLCGEESLVGTKPQNYSNFSWRHSQVPLPPPLVTARCTNSQGEEEGTNSFNPFSREGSEGEEDNDGEPDGCGVSQRGGPSSVSASSSFGRSSFFGGQEASDAESDAPVLVVCASRDAEKKPCVSFGASASRPECRDASTHKAVPRTSMADHAVGGGFASASPFATDDGGSEEGRREAEEWKGDGAGGKPQKSTEEGEEAEGKEIGGEKNHAEEKDEAMMAKDGNRHEAANEAETPEERLREDAEKESEEPSRLPASFTQAPLHASAARVGSRDFSVNEMPGLAREGDTAFMRTDRVHGHRRQRDPSLPRGASQQLLSLKEKGRLLVPLATVRYAFFRVRHPGTVLRLRVYTAMSLGMRLKASVSLSFCGTPAEIPRNPSVPFDLDRCTMLTLDDGGALTFVSLFVLRRLEKELQFHLNDSSLQLASAFDLVAGSGFGGLVALGLLRGLTLSEMLSTWTDANDEEAKAESRGGFFQALLREGGMRSRVQQLLVEHLGEQFLGTFPSGPYCLVTAADVLSQPHEVFILRSYDHVRPALHAHAYRGTARVPLWVAGWATCADGHHIKAMSKSDFSSLGYQLEPAVQLQQKSPSTSNPTLLALEEMARLADKPLSKFIQENLQLLISVGSGSASADGFDLCLRGNGRSLPRGEKREFLTEAWAKKHQVHREVLHWLADTQNMYYRLNPPHGDHCTPQCIDSRKHEFLRAVTESYLVDDKFFDVKMISRLLAHRILALRERAPPPTAADSSCMRSWKRNLRADRWPYM